MKVLIIALLCLFSTESIIASQSIQCESLKKITNITTENILAFEDGHSTMIPSYKIEEILYSIVSEYEAAMNSTIKMSKHVVLKMFRNQVLNEINFNTRRLDHYHVYRGVDLMKNLKEGSTSLIDLLCRK
ncbi:hypothetical protein [Halobacteriovorax sp. DPLXC-1]|uniref:hypothetical protein n=1 Tax=Halobacteriovorax sp. DPLXC-1 TaxID=3110771 RepID=UPI002FF183D1